MHYAANVRAAFAACVVTLALTMSGCTAQPVAIDSAGDQQNAKDDTRDWPVLELTSPDRTGLNSAVPTGARSIDITIVCAGGDYFGVSTGSAMSETRSGVCGGVNRFSMPVPKSSLDLRVEVIEGTTFTLTGAFSAGSADPDAVTMADCTAMSGISTTILNAEIGFTRGALSVEAWATRISKARAGLAAFAPEAHGMIASQMPALSAGLADPGLAPGAFHTAVGPTSMLTAMDIIAQVCVDNGSSITIMSDYGG